MSIELKLPYAEIYTIENLSHHKKSHKKDFVRQYLIENHPGFSSVSIWDYKEVYEENNKIIKAVVIDTDFFYEQKARNKNAKFYLNVDNKKIKLFNKTKYTNFLFILIFILFLLFSLIVIKQSNSKEIEEIKTEVLEQIQNYQENNPFDILNKCSQLIDDNKGKIKFVDYSLEQNGIIIFSIMGCDPYAIIDSFLNLPEIQDCDCTEIYYENDKENYEIKVILKSIQLFLEETDKETMFLLQSNVLKQFSENKIEVLSRNINFENNTNSFHLKTKYSNLGTLNYLLTKIIVQNSLYLTRLYEKPVDDVEEISVDVELVKLSNIQTISPSIIEETLSKIILKPQIKKIQNINQQEIIYEPKDEIQKKNEIYEKIGVVKKDGTNYFYYRTENGTVLVTEKELLNEEN